MGWHNPPLSWDQLERTLSGEPTAPPVADPPGRRSDPGPVSRRRKRLPPVLPKRPDDAVPYAELHAHSSYSFLDGASSPEDLLAEGDLGDRDLADIDRDRELRDREAAGFRRRQVGLLGRRGIAQELDAVGRELADEQPAAEQESVLIQVRWQDEALRLHDLTSGGVCLPCE